MCQIISNVFFSGTETTGCKFLSTKRVGYICFLNLPKTEFQKNRSLLTALGLVIVQPHIWILEYFYSVRIKPLSSVNTIYPYFRYSMEFFYDDFSNSSVDTGYQLIYRTLL